MEISPGWVSAGAGVAGLVTTVAGMWIRSAFATRDEQIAAIKATQKILFEKLDVVGRELQEYKLHVAETYVNQAALEKLLLPIERRLETIEQDLRKDSRGGGGN